jgi:zinc transport system ATP-binding protein
MPVLQVKDLAISIGKHTIIESLSFDVKAGEALAIIGPNGAGKTMLLKALLGFLKYSGEIKWKHGVKLGYVPQRMDIETDVPLTVREFFQFRGNNIRREKVTEALKAVELSEEILEMGLGEISVGQRQRILVAWAVLGNPNVLLFDEPTADIDIVGQQSIYKMIHNLQHNLGLTIILVSHDLNVIYRYANKVLCLNRRQLCMGAPKEVLTTDQLLELYGGEKGFYHHEHHHGH